MVSVRLTNSEINRALSKYDGNQIFAKILKEANNDKLLHIISQYIHFNSVFGGGVSCLAGEIAVRQSLFKTKTGTSNDRSSEIASKIFFAAIDEFGDHSKHWSTHRKLARKTLQASTDYLSGKKSVIKPEKSTLSAMRKVESGYCLNRKANEVSLLEGIGLHIGSEKLADKEFQILDASLRKRYSSLISYLEEKDAYHWIKIHTSVEENHAAHALTAANLALKFYAGKKNQREVKRIILKGVENFASLQQKFMKSL